jgi:rod shape-determining protein MreC
MNSRGLSQSKLFRITVILLILFSIALWNPLTLGSFFRGTFHTLFLPIEKVFSSVSYVFRDARDFLVSVGDIKRENERLAEENIRLSGENAGLLSMRDENEVLRKSIGLETRERFDLLGAEIVAAGGENERGSLIINRGSVHGVRTGMAVIIGEGVFVGIVRETYPLSALVTLVTDSDSALGGITIVNESQGIVRGDRNLGILFANVLQSALLSQGDRVVTSGVGGTVPPGLLIGTVSSVRDTGDRLFREASILSPVDFEKLRFLFLIR